MAETMTGVLEIGGRGQIDEALIRDDVDGLVDIPGEHASTLAEHDWRLVRFKAIMQSSPRVVPDILLSLGKPAYGLHASEWTQRVTGDAQDHIEAFSGTAAGPMLHVMRFGFYNDEAIEHETSFGICDATEIEGNSFATSQSRNEGEAYNFSEEEVASILLPEEFAAIDGLHETLAKASQELLETRQPV